MGAVPEARILLIAEDAATLAAGLRAELDARDEKIGYRIREAEVKKVPFMLVVGQREADSGTVSVRERSEGDKGSRDLDEFIREVVDAAVPNR